MENRRIVISAFGGPDVLTLESGPVPEPGDGEVRVRVLVTSAAFTDVMIRKGQYPGCVYTVVVGNKYQQTKFLLNVCKLL